MLGSASNLFHQKFHHALRENLNADFCKSLNPLRNCPEINCTSGQFLSPKIKLKWPFLERMKEIGALSILEMSVADRFAKDSPEAVAAFLCHLFLSAKEGHLCIKIGEFEVFPLPEDLWKAEEDNLTSNDILQLKNLILKGAEIAPEGLISESGFKTSTPIVRSGAFYYFHKSWNLREEFLKNLRILLKCDKPAISVNLTEAKAKLFDLVSKDKLLKEQASAILKGLESTFTIITGGPGTGKTYTAGMLIKILFEAISDPSTFSITLCAPTGKAAANLEASIAKALSSVPGFPPVSGQTLHQLLKINSSRLKEDDTVISSDVIIVDECSMIDAHLIGKLLWSIKPGARLIMLGDRYQLPSVEAGSLFADMTDLLKNHSKVAVLGRSMRSESEEILQFLDGIKAGDKKILEFTTPISADLSKINFSRLPEFKPKEFHAALVKHCLPLFKGRKEITCQSERQAPSVSKGFFEEVLHNENLLQDISLKELLGHYNQFRILTPLRKGPFGSEAINSSIYMAMKQKSNSMEAIPIMITKNDYRAQLFNGEVGVLFKNLQENYSGSYAIFPSRSFEGPLRLIPSQLLPRYEFAYCLSIHKSQGSEFDHVTLILPEGSEAFGREGFYTGASRAKKRLEIWSSIKVMQAMLERTGIRLSGIDSSCL